MHRARLGLAVMRRLGLAFVMTMAVLIFGAEIQRLDDEIKAGDFSGMAKVQRSVQPPRYPGERAQ